MKDLNIMIEKSRMIGSNDKIDEEISTYNLSSFQKEALVEFQFYLHHQAIFPLNDYLQITETQFYFLADKLNPLFSAAFMEYSYPEYTVEIQLAITLKYLTTNEFCLPQSLGMLSLKKVMMSMVYQMSEWLFKVLKDKFLIMPTKSEDWQMVTNKFTELHNMPFCMGVLSLQRLGTTQVPIRFSRKCAPHIFTSIVDAHNNFMYADVQRSLAMEWDRFFEESDIKKLIECKKFNFPTGFYNDQENIEKLRFFVGDNSLPNTAYLLSDLHILGPVWNGNHFVISQCTPDFLEYSFCKSMNGINMHTKQALHALKIVFPPVAELWRIDTNKARKVLMGSILLYNYFRYLSKENRSRIDALNDHAPPIVPTGLDAAVSFNRLLKQKGDTDAGLRTQKRVMVYMSIRRLPSLPSFYYNVSTPILTDMLKIYQNDYDKPAYDDASEFIINATPMHHKLQLNSIF